MQEYDKKPYIIANMNEAMLEDIKMLEKELSLKTDSNIVLIAYQPDNSSK